MSFSKTPGKKTPQCYTKPLDSLKNWNNRFFWVDECVFPTAVEWQTNASKDGIPANGTYSMEAVRVLDTHRTPIQKQPEMLLCLVEMDLFSLIHAPNPTKVKTESRPRAPHELPLLTLTTPRVIAMDEPATTTDSSGVPSAIESSPLDFAYEAEAFGREAAAPEMPPPEEVPITTAPGAGQATEAVVVEPHAVRESRKRGHEGIDANAPPKSLQRDHADLQPSSSSRGEKSLAAMQLCLASNVFMSSQGIAVAEDPRSENASSPIEVGSPGSVYRPEWGVTNGSLLDTPEACQDLMDHAAPPDFKVRNEHLSQRVAALQEQVSGEEKLKAAFEEFKRYKDDRVEQWCTELDARLDALSIDFDEELYPHMLTAIAGRRRLPMLWGLKHGVEHGRAQLELESIEAYDPEAEAKFVAALQSLKDSKFSLLDELESLKDAPMDVIMAALYLESDTGGDALQYIRDLRPNSSQLTIPVYSEVRDPRNPWACKEEIALADPIATNISRAEKKKKCRIVCRTHGVGSTHHARSDDVPVSVPSVVPQGLALLLVDGATQTDHEDSHL
nr:hypothetical protein [Tanacetum cinerariifolium]